MATHFIIIKYTNTVHCDVYPMTSQEEADFWLPDAYRYGAQTLIGFGFTDIDERMKVSIVPAAELVQALSR
jgi:hypothetical protein